MSVKLNRGVLIASIILGSGAVSVALPLLKAEPEMQPVTRPDPLVDVLEIEPMATQFSVHSQGTVKPLTETVVSAEVSGLIVEVSPKFVAGALFAADEVLLRIDASDFEVAVTQAEALVHQRRIEHEAATKLRSQGFRAETEHASAAAALAAAESELVRARRNLERTEIRAPYMGLVRSKSVDLGQFVTPGTPLGVVFASDAAEVRLPLRDEDLAFLALPATNAQLTNNPRPGPDVVLSAVQAGELRSWPAIIVRQEAVVDERSRMTYAVARIEDPYRLRQNGAPLPIGSFVAAAIEGNEIADVVRLPVAAIRGQEQILLVDNDNRLHNATVDIIRSGPEYVYVHAENLLQWRVVLTPIASPEDGMPVRTFPSHSGNRLAVEGSSAP